MWVTEIGYHETHEDVGYRNWVYQEHMRMGRLHKMGIIRTLEDVGYRNWVSQEHMRMWVTEIGYTRNK
jgi:hypothetical protein